jgi:hypothetical protein
MEPQFVESLSNDAWWQDAVPQSNINPIAGLVSHCKSILHCEGAELSALPAASWANQTDF